jgi:hypothetical protein
MIYVRGTGRIMPKSVDVDLRNLTAGDATSRTITVDVPEKIQSVNFSYSIEPRAAAPYTTASIKSPLGPSKSQQLTLTVTANPQNKVDERSTYMLLRRGVADRLLDSTELVLDVQASSRPVRFTVSSDTDTLTARIGDTVDVNIRARTNDPIDEPIELSSLQFDLSYNPTVFVPIRSSGQTLSVVNDQQILTTVIDAFAVPLAITTDGQIIGTVRGVVALGDADYSPLAISSVAFVRGQNQTDTMANGQAILRITNVWRYADGRTRLANPLQGTMMMDIDPNPVIDNSTLRLRNIPQGTGSLVVIDALGVLRQDLTTALKGGKRDFTVASSGSADIVLSPGTYYARCAIESVLGGTLNSIVRVFVVQ